MCEKRKFVAFRSFSGNAFHICLCFIVNCLFLFQGLFFHWIGRGSKGSGGVEWFSEEWMNEWNGFGLGSGGLKVIWNGNIQRVEFKNHIVESSIRWIISMDHAAGYCIFHKKIKPTGPTEKKRTKRKEAHRKMNKGKKKPFDLTMHERRILKKNTHT